MEVSMKKIVFLFTLMVSSFIYMNQDIYAGMHEYDSVPTEESHEEKAVERSTQIDLSSFELVEQFKNDDACRKYSTFEYDPNFQKVETIDGTGYMPVEPGEYTVSVKNTNTRENLSIWINDKSYTANAGREFVVPGLKFKKKATFKVENRLQDTTIDVPCCFWTIKCPDKEWVGDGIISIYKKK